MIILERRGKLLGILPQIKNKMLLETTPPKDDKYESQGYWVGNKSILTKFDIERKDLHIIFMLPDRPNLFLVYIVSGSEAGRKMW